MEQADILSKLEDIFSDTFLDDDYVFSADLTRDEITEWDSLNHIRLLTAIEKSFGFRFDIAEIESLSSVEAFVDSISTKS